VRFGFGADCPSTYKVRKMLLSTWLNQTIVSYIWGWASELGECVGVDWRTGLNALGDMIHQYDQSNFCRRLRYFH